MKLIMFLSMKTTPNIKLYLVKSTKISDQVSCPMMKFIMKNHLTLHHNKIQDDDNQHRFISSLIKKTQGSRVVLMSKLMMPRLKGLKCEREET